jgi:DNA-binding IclR family transcriptional regulator
VRAYPVMRTVRALERLAFRSLSAPELAIALQVHQRTARRLLQRLVLEDYAAETGDAWRRYRLTLRLAALGRQLIAHTQWPREAGPWVAKLAAQTQHRAGLWIPCYPDVVCVVNADPHGPPSEPHLGVLLPAHASAPGKALLAHREPWRESLLAGHLERRTPATRTDPRDLCADLDRVRARGYAIDAGEHDPRVHAIAAPVFVLDDSIAALGISLTARNEHAQGFDSLSGSVVSVAAALGAALSQPRR